MTLGMAATGNAANRPSALSNAKSSAACTFTTLAETPRDGAKTSKKKISTWTAFVQSGAIYPLA
jgi:hypothetical protein